MASWYHAKDNHRKYKQNGELVPGERDAFDVRVEVAVAARHDRHVTAVVVVQHLPRVLHSAQPRYDIELLLYDVLQ